MAWLLTLPMNITTLSINQLLTIDTSNLANAKGIFTSTKDNSCLMALYKDNKHQIDSYCTYKVNTNSLEPSIVHLKDSSYLLTNIDTYKLACTKENKIM